MLKIRALNRESSSDEDVPVIRREAQEEIVLELYNKALRLQSESSYSESESILIKIINENIPLLENNGGLPKSMSTLKYSCHVNVGNVYLKQNKVEEALQMYLEASELDGTDVTLWYKIGQLSLKQDKFRQSAYAFSKGLECSESNWPCLDQLISILFAIRDIVSCLLYIGKALILDPDYVKGLVLRKQIYRDNPAAKDYYQLYNPDYVWEPELDIKVDEDDEKTFLQEVRILCDRVNELEKSLGPQPLQTIALPKALEEYTWLSLANTIVYLHQYITENHMSHFTMIDISKCMSQSSEVIDRIGSTIDKDVEEQLDDKPVDSVMSTEQLNGFSTDEKMEVDPVLLERRFSVNSETNTELQENTPVQTDNDEEANMDQENEEQDESSETKTEKSRPRGSKRKRDLLSDLQIWGWHSKRKQSKKAKEKFFTLEDVLNRIIPKNLLPDTIRPEKIGFAEESMNTMDLYNLYVEDNNVNYLSPIHSPKSVNYEPYFGTDRERDDVLEFWTEKRVRCDAVVLVKQLVFVLSKLWHYKWPKELVAVYVSAYDMFREHCDQPQLFCGDFTFEEMRDDALATILYGELLSFSSDGKETIHPMLLGYLQLISGWEERWQDEFAEFFCRVYWLRSYLFRKENSNDLAVRALQLIQEVIEETEERTHEKFMLSLPNCFKYGLITSHITQKILKHLDLMNALATVENLFNAEKYVEAAAILKLTFDNATANHPQVGKMGRPAQLGILLHSLWFTDMTECFIWCEECLFEALDHFLKPKKDLDKWEKIIEKCLAMMHEIIKKESVRVIDVLAEEKRARLVQTLAKIVSKQLNVEHATKLALGCVTPWILLHYSLVREEQKQYAIKRAQLGKREMPDATACTQLAADELPPSVAILFSAHDFLGPKGWCLSGQGELLHFILDTVLDRLDTPVFENLKDKIDIHLEQAFFCLYQHPSKKNKISRHLADHNVDPLPLTWERAFQLYEFYGPDSLPEFNSYKNASISTDLEQLLKRIIALVPANAAPQHHLTKIMDFIYGKSTKLPEPIDFPGKVQAIYYLIGDFYFKQKEFNRCIKYFQMDLCINPRRLDSWACLGLSYAAQLDAKLNHCEKFKTETEFLDKAKYATICFEQSLLISPDHLVLWIEFGTFQYTVHSYCSRILKYESENLSMEKFEFLENQKNHYLDSSGNSFEKAIALYEMEDNNEPDERWLQYYILGKIAEKKQKEPAEYLNYYITASTLLNENNAEYPDKIHYNNPQHLAVEALELHYRIHASVLKYLELREGKDLSNTLGSFFRKCLNQSTCFKKKPAKEAAEIAATQPVETSGNSGCSFQEQFLNSIKKVNGSELGLPMDDDETVKVGQEVPPATTLLEPISDKVEVKVSKDIDNPMKEIEDFIKETENVAPVKESLVKEIANDRDIECNTTADVIMILDSDSDEKKITNIDTCRRNTVPVGDVVEKEPIANTPAIEKKEVKDVQKVLDEMMEQTMNETLKQSELDSDVSAADKVEEVTIREDKDAPHKAVKAKKAKKSDSETDTENRRNSNDSSVSSSSSGSSSSSSDSDSEDDSSSSSSSSSSEEDNENMSNSEISELIEKCASGLEICIIRLGQNYKALYRLAHLYSNYKPKKDLAKSRQLLLGEYKCRDGTTVGGLFNERKVNNFFNGIWRIPSTEIDRPGSLSAHMSRCISLVLQILRNSNDNKTLIDLAIQLRKIPEPDKIYIKDADRMAFSEQALSMCTQTLRAEMKSVPEMANTQIVKLLQDIFKVYQRIQKHIPGKETVFGNMLVEVYKKLIKEKIADNVNVLELATKLCVQNKQAEKQKALAAQNQILLPRGPGVAPPPVLPTPATLVAPSTNVPLKRPAVSRPRGRPPLPKVPGQVRQPRVKNGPAAAAMATSTSTASTSKAYNWQKSLYDQTYAYEYLKHYQDELIKQYSQTLSIGQLTQLSQILTQGQLNNPLTATTIAGQFLSQTGLLNPNTLVKQIGGSGTGSNQATTTQLMDSLNHLTPSLKKKLGVDQVLSGMTSDQLKFLETMLPPVPKTTIKSNTTLPLTITTSSGIATTKQKPSVSSKQMAQTVMSMLTETNKIKSSSAAALPTKPTNVFKEPAITKQASFESGKVTKDFIKDRPNISITPVNLPLPSNANAFVRPTVTSTPSSGKTLQEKLAEKKKEQLNKQLKSSLETDLRSDPLMKSLNIPGIPSSLTVSKAHVPVSAHSYPMCPNPLPNMSKSISTNSSGNVPKYPLDLGRSSTTITPALPPTKTTKPVVLPPSVTYSKTAVTLPAPVPKFSVESGLSISQWRQRLKSELTSGRRWRYRVESTPNNAANFTASSGTRMPIECTFSAMRARAGQKEMLQKGWLLNITIPVFWPF